MVQLVEMFVEKTSPVLYAQLGIFLPLIAVNCAILGASLFMQEREYANMGEVTAFAPWFRNRMVLAIVGIAAITRKAYVILKYLPPKRFRYNLYHNRTYGNSFYELF